MANVFTKQSDVVNKPRRNVFDLSHANNLTLRFGALTPCYCEEVIPGDSFQIETRMALKLMPMVFPVQTDMRAYVHFFYVRNRNLWKDWQNFIGMLPQGYTEDQMKKYLLPYICFDDSGIGIPRTGSLSDYLGIPSTVAGRYGSEENLTFTQNFAAYIFKNEQNHNYIQFPISKVYDAAFENLMNGGIGQLIGDPIDFYVDTKLFNDFNYTPTDNYERAIGSSVTWTVSNPISPASVDLELTHVDGVECVTLNFKTYTPGDVTNGAKFIFIGVDVNNNICWSTPVGVTAGAAAQKTITFTLNRSLWLQTARIVVLQRQSLLEFPISVEAVPFTYQPDGSIIFDTGTNTGSTLYMSIVQSPMSGDNYCVDIDENTSPYYQNSNGKGIKISALPYRAYESVYNAFYRDPRNNPYILNGTPEYNKWCPSLEGGVDKYNYQLHYRNWESDYLTTALPSPQQGEAPLVGITNSGKLAFVDETGTTYRAELEFNEDNSALSGINVQASSEPVGSLTRIVDFATSGISIADLRGVNALQRWLEINARRGYRYKDQIKSHFDVDIRFDELDMPEFLGGCSADIYVNQISQTVNQSDSGTWQDTLGAYAGQGFTRLETSRPIRHYFDEHGYIIGIISVVPVPCYSQLLPKHFLKRSPLDFYFPEFSKLGMQPITYSEVCPVQAFRSSGVSALDDTFGYQRAWYEYLQRVDEVHGSFRLNMRNFLINRVFNRKPELSEEFLTVNPEQINDVFSVTEDSDKIFGQIYFKVTAKRPIPEYGIPALE